MKGCGIKGKDRKGGSCKEREEGGGCKKGKGLQSNKLGECRGRGVIEERKKNYILIRNAIFTNNFMLPKQICNLQIIAKVCYKYFSLYLVIFF